MRSINNKVRGYIKVKKSLNLNHINVLRIGSIVILMMLLFSSLQIQEKSEELNNRMTGRKKVGAFTLITKAVEGTDYSYSSNVLTINTDKPITIINTNTTTDSIYVDDNYDTNITLDGVSIDVSSGKKGAFVIADGNTKNVTITLADGSENVLKSDWSYAGIQKNGDASSGKLLIRCESDGDKGHVCTDECGKVNALAEDWAAGIGGAGNSSSNCQEGSNITINGGNITASGVYGSGIGGGPYADGNNITINGGTVIATGVSGGSGIGGGKYAGDGNNITINGGIVTATGSTDSAGIGGGEPYNSEGGNGNNIKITGGTVMATTNGCCGAGIGGGRVGDGANILIEGGNVTATGGDSGAGIGGGSNGNGSYITITGGTITASAKNQGAGIGSGYYGVAEHILINGGIVTATGGYGGAGIGGAYSAVGKDIKIIKGQITATGGESAAGIGGGYTESANSKESSITIEGGIITAKSSGRAAGIGGGAGGHAIIAINGGCVMATGGANRVAIGSGVSTTTESTITVNTELVEAKDMYSTEISYPNIADLSSYNYVKLFVPFLIEGGIINSDYEYNTTFDTLTIKTDETLKISNTNKEEATTANIVVASGVAANVILTGVNIDVSSVSDVAFKIADNSTGNVTITLADGSENILKSGYACAGLQKNGDINSGVLMIKCVSCGVEGHVCTDKCGKLTAISNQGAGIGGGGIYQGSNQHGSNIIINGGVVNATGTSGGVGIGGGHTGTGNNITINGGVVNATGAVGGAGIGGGYNASGNNITINGGVVNATGGSDYGAGIGGGYNASGNNITINGGKVEATGGNSGAGIGGGENGQGYNIVIADGEVNAKGYSTGAGIGGGKRGNGEKIIINGGKVTATGGRNSASGIGGGNSGGVGKDIKISGGKIYAQGGVDGGAGIGGGYEGNENKITIEGGTITSIGGNYAAGIGGGSWGGNSEIIITGGKVIAGDSNKTDSVGIGSGNNGATTNSKINITGGEVIAQGTLKAINDLVANISLTNVDIIKASTYVTGENADSSPSKGEISGYLYIQIKEYTGDFEVSGTGYSFDDTNRILNITDGAEVTIKNKNIDTATTDSIVVAKGAEANVTLAGVKIEKAYEGNAVPLQIEENSEGNVTIILADGSTNTLTSNSDYAAIEKNSSEDSGVLLITCEGAEGKGHICTDECGRLDVINTIAGAGIGGSYQKSASNIMINGGKINAKGGSGAAGIGGGDSGGSGNNITINGGEITTEGRSDGAGIGGGENGVGKAITINGGKIIASSTYGGAGIGGGSYGDGCNIIINDGTIYATGGGSAAGIGGGINGDGRDIQIKDGYVEATAGNNTVSGGAGIGGGLNSGVNNENGYGRNIEIRGGTVIATGAQQAAGIGAGDNSSAENIRITGGNLTAIGGRGGASIGGSYYGYAEGIVISGGTVIAGSDSIENSIGIGAGKEDYYYSALLKTTVTITGGSVIAKGTLKAINVSPENLTLTNVDIIKACSDATGQTEVSTPSKNDILTYLYVEIGIYTGDFEVTGTCYNFNSTDRILNITDGAEVTIKNKNVNTATTDRIVVAKDADVEITLAGVYINSSGTSYSAAFKIEDDSEGNVMIILADGSDNKLISGSQSAGLQKNGEKGNLTITCMYEGQGHMCDDSCGKLQAKGGSQGAGIGSQSWNYGRYITIAGGNITATGGSEGAGIGSGANRSGSYITITGGVVTAQGGYDGAGIGGSMNCSGENIIINGGVITATGGEKGAGIGGGYYGVGKNIDINGGIVNAIGGEDASGIGGGYNDSGNNIIINNGTITAVGKAHGAGIGGSDTSGGSNVTINGGTIVAISKQGAALGGYNSTYTNSGVESLKNTVVINGGMVTAKSEAYAIGAETKFELGHNTEEQMAIVEGSTDYDYSTDTVSSVEYFFNPESVIYSMSYAKIKSVPTYYYSYDVANNSMEKVLSSGEKSAVDLSDVITIEDNGSDGKKMILKDFKHTTINKYALYINGDIDIYLEEGTNNVIENVYTVSDTCSTIGALYINGKLNKIDGKGNLKIFSRIDDVDNDGISEGASYGIYASSGMYVDNINSTIETHGTSSCAFNTDSTQNCVVEGKIYASKYECHGDIAVESLTIITDMNINYSAYKYAKTFCIKTIVGPFVVIGGKLDTNFTYNDYDDILSIIDGSEDLKIANVDPKTETNGRIYVESGVSINITLDGVNINVSGTANSAAFKIADNSTGNVKIILADDKNNILKSGENCAGLQKNGAYNSNIGKLIIQCEHEVHDCIETCGRLTLKGGNYGAGIGGGGEYNSQKNIIINGGIINAKGGSGAAGIGGGYNADSNYMEINGGKIEAEGGEGTTYGKAAAGIGGGMFKGGYDIYINGGEIIALGHGEATAIGAGCDSVECRITIKGGKITATNTSSNGVGIGRGYKYSNTNITNAEINIESVDYILAKGTDRAIYGTLNMDEFKNSIVEACAVSCSGTSIGRGVKEELSQYKHVKITSNLDNVQNNIVGDFRVTNGEYGIDYTYNSDSKMLIVLKEGANLTIENVNKDEATDNRIAIDGDKSVTIKLTGINIQCSTRYHSGIEIQKNSTGNIKLILADGSKNTLKGGTDGSGIQRIIDSYNQTEGKLIIMCENGDDENHVCSSLLCGKLIAYGGSYGAGIGGGASETMSSSYAGAGRNIEINGGNIEAKGESGIGGGKSAEGSNIIIKKGIIKAEGTSITTYAGAGIGGGSYAPGKDIYINGGEIIATAKGFGAAIGAGSESTTCSVTINGGKITANSTAGAGIGRGYKYSNTNVNNAIIVISSADNIQASGECRAIYGSVTMDEKLVLEEASLYENGTSSVTEPSINNIDSYLYVKISPKVINVTITWGNLDYTYKAGAWQTGSLEYAQGVFEPTDTNGGDKITVQNDSNVNIATTITCTMDSGYQSIQPSILETKPSGTDIMGQAKTVYKGSILDTYLVLTGKMPIGNSVTKVGSVAILLAS